MENLPLRALALLPALLIAAACAPTGSASEEAATPATPAPMATATLGTGARAFDAVGPEETVTLLGNEPFWNLTITAGEGLWTTPENQPGTRFAIARVAGNGGLGFTGTLEGKPLAATLTPGACSDGMSDRSYPFVATIAWGEETLKGCGYTTNQPFSGDPSP